MIPLDHRDRGIRADPYTEHNSCFSDSSDSLNSLNSMKVPLHLEKTPLNPMFHTFAEFRLIVNRIVARQSTDWLAANEQFSPNGLVRIQYRHQSTLQF